MDLWAIKLKHMSDSNRELAKAHRATTDRVLALEKQLDTEQANVERAALHRKLADLPQHEQHKCARLRWHAHRSASRHCYVCSVLEQCCSRSSKHRITVISILDYLLVQFRCAFQMHVQFKATCAM